MEIEKTLTVAVAREQVWALLLNPQVMASAVPGMKSIEIVSPTEYLAVMHQKISFINAKFKLRTHIVEQRAPEYLRVKGTGEDAGVASSLKQTSEVFLMSTPDNHTELRIKVNIDLIGRLGTFGLSVMKTKADRIWEEFGANLAARLEGGDVPEASSVQVSVAATNSTNERTAAAAVIAAPAPAQDSYAPEPTTVEAAAQPAARSAPTLISAAQGLTWRERLFGARQSARSEEDTIYVEVRRGDTTIAVRWPGTRGKECAAWLRDL